MLSTGQLASMRATLNRTFADTATIYRKTTENVGGEEIETWAVLATAPCRIAPATTGRGGEGGTVGGKIEDETTHVVTVAADTDVEEADVVVVSDVAYEAVLVRKRGAWELSRRVECMESVEGIPEVV